MAGSRQTALGIMDGRPVITLIFTAYIGAKEEHDSIVIKGTPSVLEKITPCVHGDLATAAIIVNSIPKVLNASLGLKTMKDLPVPSIMLGDIRRYLGRNRARASILIGPGFSGFGSTDSKTGLTP